MRAIFGWRTSSPGRRARRSPVSTTASGATSTTGTGTSPPFEGFRVLRYDTRGHGGSDAPPGPYRLEMLAADVVGLQDALGIERVHFCGVSIGGQIAQTFALDYPERVASLILVNTTCEYSDDQVARWRERARQVLEGGIEPLHATLMARWFTDEAVARQPPGYCYMAEAIRRFPPQSFAAAVEAMCHLHTTARLPRIAAPTLVIGTPEDPGAPREVTEKMARLIPNAELEWLTPAPAPLEPGAPRALQFARPGPSSRSRTDCKALPPPSLPRFSAGPARNTHRFPGWRRSTESR